MGKEKWLKKENQGKTEFFNLLKYFDFSDLDKNNK